MERGLILLIAALMMSYSSVRQVNGSTNPTTYTQPYRNPTPGELPVVAWSTYNANVNTPDFYRGLAECGINIYFLCLEPNDSAIIAQSLDMCGRYGLKEFIHCRAAFMQYNIKSTVDKFRDNPNLAGFAIDDEPNAPAFPQLRKLRDIVYSQDTTSLLYINLFPNSDLTVLKAKNYWDYLTNYIETVDPPFISYDNYPITFGKRLYVSETYYENLEEIHAASLKYGKPFWGFANTMERSPFPNPTIGFMRFQVFSNLAYGAQGIQYYRYWANISGGYEDNGAPVLPDGKKSDIWYRLRQLNREIKALTPIFLGCKVIDVRHTGNSIPKGTKRLSGLPGPFTRIQSEGTGILVSTITNNNKNYLVMVNRDVENSQKVRLSWNGLLKIIDSEGKIRNFRSSSIKLEPGSYAIFNY